MAGVSETHPRPQLQRPRWASLDGRWDFALDPEGDWSLPGEVIWDRSILVPFAPETVLSGVAAEGFFRSCWYRRTVRDSPAQGGERIFLMFGAVDYSASGLGRWIAMPAVTKADTRRFRRYHRSAASRDGSTRSLVLRRRRPARPRQAARQAGLAARAAFDLVSANDRHLADGLARERARDLDRNRCAGPPNLRALGDRASRRASTAIRATTCGSSVDAARRRQRRSRDDRYSVVAGEVHRRIALSDPGIDDFRNELLWSPAVAHPDRRARCASGPARRGHRRGRQLHGAARGRRPGRPLRAQRPALPAAAWCSTRATGPTAA